MNGKTLLPIPILVNGDMSLTSLTSTTLPIQWEDSVALQFTWSGSPVGTIAINVSLDQVNWVPLPVASFTGTYPVPGTTTSPAIVEVVLSAVSYLQVVYTKVSGSGTLNVKAAAKGI